MQRARNSQGCLVRATCCCCCALLLLLIFSLQYAKPLPFCSRGNRKSISQLHILTLSRCPTHWFIGSRSPARTPALNTFDTMQL